RIRAHDRAADLVDDEAARCDRLAAVELRFAEDFPAHLADDRGEGALHVRGLARLVFRPLPMETQRGDAPAILHARIDLAVRILVRNHLAAARQADERAVVATHVLFEFATVAAGEGGHGSHAVDARHAPAAARLDVIAARETELARVLVEPPRRIDVNAAGPVFVHRRQVFQHGNLPRDMRADGVHEVLADFAARV